jgi:hypothetical protein
MRSTGLPLNKPMQINRATDGTPNLISKRRLRLSLPTVERVRFCSNCAMSSSDRPACSVDSLCLSCDFSSSSSMIILLKSSYLLLCFFFQFYFDAVHLYRNIVRCDTHHLADLDVTVVFEVQHHDRFVDLR